MKQSSKRAIVIALVATVVSTATAPSVQAGPWLDSILRSHNPPPAYPVGAPVPVSTSYGNYALYPNYAGYTQTANYGYYGSNLPPTYAPVLPAGIPQTSAGYLPTAAYDTQWNRTPVTYYRPVTAFDPRYGTTVTSLQPCTSYQYQAQRVPLVAPRPLLGTSQWPAITSPGYNPTGLAYSAQYPTTYPAIQTIPNGGAPVAFNSGISTGMPTSSMPLATMNYSPSYLNSASAIPAYSIPQTSSLMPSSSGTINGTPVLPGYSAYPTQSVYQAPYAGNLGPNCVPNVGAVGTGSVLGGMSAPAPMPSTNTNVPYIPGATSVTPLGPPTYSPSPNGGVGTSSPLNSPYPSNQVLPGSSPAIPGGQVLPPGFNGGLRDEESIRTPTLNSNGNFPRPSGDGQLTSAKPNPQVANGANTDLFVSNENKPRAMIPIDPPQWRPNTAGSPAYETRAYDAQPQSNSQITGLKPQPPVPSPALVNPSFEPLRAPQEFDSKPRFNPNLLNSQDKTAQNRGSRIQLSGEDERDMQGRTVSSGASLDSGLVQFIGNTKVSTKTKEIDSYPAPVFRPITQPR